MAPADSTRPAIAVAGDAVEGGSMPGGERVGDRQVVVAAPADAGVWRWHGLRGRGTRPAPTHAREQDDHADPPPVPVSVDQHATSTVQSNAFAWTVETGSIPLSPWQTAHASAPPGAVFVAACAAVAGSSWQERQASWIGGIAP